MIENGVRVDGLGVRCLEEGSGSPILLVHGGTLGYSAELWRNCLAPLAAAGHRVITYDQPGFGLSDEPPEFGLRYRQDFIVKLMDALDLQKLLLVGHSQAGGLVVGAALQTPERFSGVVVLGTGSLLPPLATPQRDVEPPADSEPTLADTKALLEANLHRRAVITPQLLTDYHRMSIARNFTNARRRAAAGSGKAPGAGVPLWQRLGEVSVPLMMIYGANDRASAAERVGLARTRYPGIEYHLLENCHHIVQWDQPDAVVHLVLDFNRRLSAAR